MRWVSARACTFESHPGSLSFFGHPKLSVRLYAIFGGSVLLCYSSYMAWFALQLVEWRGAFFDMLEKCSARAPECSGDTNPIYTLLLQFLLIVLPAIIISCVMTWHRKVYLVTWRCDITRSYYRKWKGLGCPEIEGAAQRMQEDTGKFVWDIESIVTDLLNAMLDSNADSRCSIEDVLAHPWLAPHEDDLDAAGAREAMRRKMNKQ